MPRYPKLERTLVAQHQQYDVARKQERVPLQDSRHATVDCGGRAALTALRPMQRWLLELLTTQA